MAYKNPEDQKSYARQHYLDNRASYIARAKAARPEREKIAYEYVAAYLSTHPCVDCGEDDLRVLQFDHRDEKTKRRTVSNLINSGVAPKRLDAEIALCDVRCANCHIKRTRIQFGFRTWGVIPEAR